jgi:hypothetical protein
MDTKIIDNIIKDISIVQKIKFKSAHVYMRWRKYGKSMDISINTSTSSSIDDIKTEEDFIASLYEYLRYKKGSLSVRYLI